MNSPTEVLYVFRKTKEKRAMRKQAAWQLALAAALILLGGFFCLNGPVAIGMPALVLGGFSGGLGVSRLHEAASIDDVFSG